MVRYFDVEFRASFNCSLHHVAFLSTLQTTDTMFVRRVALTVARSTPSRAPIAARTFTSSIVRRKSRPSDERALF